MGILASLLANINRDKTKGEPYKPIDFMPYILQKDREALRKSNLSQRLAHALKSVKAKKRESNG